VRARNESQFCPTNNLLKLLTICPGGQRDPCNTVAPPLGNAYLDLLRFFLNHRRFMRSRCTERHGKSPREVMTGEGHPHWLTLLGFGPLQPQRG
jgi:hypothetical protein